jgi:hypothetical protein
MPGARAAAAAVVAVVGMVMGAGLAKAAPAYDRHSTAPWSGPMGDENAAAYRADIAREAGGSVADARALADTICSHLRGGITEDHLVADMAHDQLAKMGDVIYIVHGAEWHFCPEKY